MSKELLGNLLIEFDEMGFEPTILCDSKKEIDSFRNRLKQVLDYFKSIDNANPSEALEKLDKINIYLNDAYDYKEIKEEVQKDINSIKQTLFNKSQKELAFEKIQTIMDTYNTSYIMDIKSALESIDKIIEEVLKHE